MPTVYKLVASILFVLAGMPASAQDLYGNAITAAVYFPTYGAIYPSVPSGAPYTVVAGPVSPDLTFFTSARFDVDYQQDKISILIDDSGCCTQSTSFNGLSFKIIGATFSSASLLTTNIANFGSDRVYLYSPSELLVNVGGGLNLDSPNSIITISVSAVPEESTLALFAAGLIALLPYFGKVRKARRR